MAIRRKFVPATRALAALASLAVAASVQAAPAFVPENQPIGYLGQPRSTSLNVTDGNQLAYYGDYERQFWSGNLKPFNIAPEGRLDVESDLWPGGAGPVLNTQDWKTGRKIVTLKSDNGARVAFFRGNLHSSQQSWITDKQVQYVRGSRANEAPSGDKLRARRYVLGDIIRSRPAYVGKRLPVNSTTAPADATPPMIYVGANDGMLHAFRADNGEEAYAYIPSMLIPKLANLAPPQSTGYTHTHFVDASPRAAVVRFVGESADRRILVGGLGAGGRGLYALDITADAVAPPTTETGTGSTAATMRMLWEITPDRITRAGTGVTTTNAYANLGHTYGEPIVGKANNGNDVIFMPNGYMNTMVSPAVPGVTNAGTGTASLFVIDPKDGALIRQIDTEAGNTTTPNGLSSPTPVDIDGDGRIDYLYAGDLDGKLWRFDVTASTPSSWSVSPVYTTDPVQSITMAPAVADHPRGGRMVAFGTGRTLMAADMTNEDVHYMYGIWDGAPNGLSALLAQTLNPTEVFVSDDGNSVRRVRTLSITAPDWTVHRGWRVAMPAGERFVGDRPTLTNARVYANTFNPTVNLDGLKEDPVEPIYENWKYQFNFLNGGGAVKPIFDLNLDGLFNDGDVLPQTDPARPMNERVAAGLFQNAGVASQPVVVTTTIGSQDLYAQNADLPAIEIGDPGVSGGHFDVDIYYPTSIDKGLYKDYKSRKHIHEYDDKFGVTGVNMLNASDPNLNLKMASYAVKQIAPRTPFKVLIMNQYLNPAAGLRVGRKFFPPEDPEVELPYVRVRDFGGQAQQTDAQALLDSMQAYVYDPATPADIPPGAQALGQLVMALPKDAFASKEWDWSLKSGVGNADIRAGLIPTTTGCVNSISDSNFVSTPGAQQERHNGALTVQLIRADTPASALEMNVAGAPQYGWRVKASEYRKHMLVLWTFFWHHPNGKCYGKDAAWVPNPPQDASGGTPGKPPPGTDDPQDGAFNAIGNNSGGGLQCGGSIAGKTLTTNKQTLTTTEVITYSDKCTITTVLVRDGSGGIEETRTVRLADGTLEVAVRTYREVEAWTPNHARTSATVGRISWRELIRQ